MLGRGGGGGGGARRGGGGRGARGARTTLGPRGRMGGMHGGPHHGGSGGGHGGWHGWGGRRRRLSGGQWWAFFPGYGWIVDAGAACTWGDPLASPPDALVLVAAQALADSGGDPVSDDVDGEILLFSLEAGTTIQIRPCVATLGAPPMLERPEGRGVYYGPAMLGQDAGDPNAENVAQIQSSLAGAMSPAQLSSVVATYTGLGQVQSQSALSLVGHAMQGTKPTWQEVAPLVGAAVALIPGVGPVTVAVVAAAVEFIPAILSALGLSSSPQQCAWNVGSVCFTGIIPYGPDDPNWVTFEAFANNQADASLEGGIDASFPDYSFTIGCELPIIDAIIASHVGTVYVGASNTPAAGGPSAGALGVGAIIAGATSGPTSAPLPPAVPPAPPGPDLMIYLFLRTYYSAWQQNAEQAINGHPYAKDADLLTTVVTAWNNTHNDHFQFTFQPATATLADIHTGKTPGPCAAGQSLIDPGTPTFVSLLLSGQIDGAAQPALTINTGPSITAAPPAPAASSSSAGVVLGAAAILATLASWATKIPTGIWGKK